MSLQCSADGGADYYVDAPEELSVCSGTLFCRECGELIPAGTEHYRFRNIRSVDYGDEYMWEFDEVFTGLTICCEPCGDLALSWIELGFCWTLRDLRNDIKEWNYHLYGDRS